MAKKKEGYNAVRQAIAIDAVVDAQIALPAEKRDSEALGNALGNLHGDMETWPEAVKRLTKPAKKKAAPKKEA